MPARTTLAAVPAILLKDFWKIANVKDYKVHFARFNGGEQPLDAWVSDRSKWVGWQEHRPRSNAFSRPYIFSLMNFHPDGDKSWLFGGVFRVVGRHADRYEVELTDQGEPYIGRLKLRSDYTNRATRVNFENHYAQGYPLQVAALLDEPYSGQIFPGYEDIDLSFAELETLMRNERPDWKAALQNAKGVYLITDTSSRTPTRYVGSAYGEDGIWSRWRDYVETGHGGNAELKDLVGDLDYCRANFRFALLEYLPSRTEDDTVIARETHWKNVLLTREHGLNQN